MAASPPFVARLLQGSAGGYAGLAAASLLEQHPDIRSRYEPHAFDDWKHHLEERIEELAAAVVFEEPQLLVSQVRWGRESFQAHDRPTEDLKTSLSTLKEVLGEQLPADASERANRYLELAIGSFDTPVQETSILAGDAQQQGRVLGYLAAALEGERQRAFDILAKAVDDGLSVLDAYEKVLVPAQRRIGQMWHAGELNVAEEHLATSISTQAVTFLGQRMPKEPAIGKTAVAATPPGNAHDLGLRILAEAFHARGWKILHLGSDVPIADFVEALPAFGADLVLLSASLVRQLEPLKRTIQTVREADADRQLKILVGGRVFGEVPRLWSQVGADGYAGSASEAIDEAWRLVGSG